MAAAAAAGGCAGQPGHCFMMEHVVMMLLNVQSKALECVLTLASCMAAQ
jgi:hypothetical protein